MENIKRLTNKQVLEIAKSVNQGYELKNYKTWCSVMDRKTKICEHHGGKYNFTSYNKNLLIRNMYLSFIEESELYFDWQTNGFACTEDRKAYLYKIIWKVTELLCGFKTCPAELAEK